MTKTLDLIMLRFDSFVQGGEVELGGEKSGRSGSGRSDLPPEVLGNFVVIEGLDGSGTTTQLHLAEERLKDRGIPHFCTGEPTRGPVGLIIRQILKRQIQARPDTVALLFAADRSEHLYAENDGILAHLGRDRLVVCDRYLFSSLAYQSLACDPQFVFSLNCRFPLPRHLVFLDTPVDLSQQRLATRAAGGPELYDGREIQQAILAAYERSFMRFANTEMQLHRLDGSQDPELVFEKFWSILTTLPIVKA
ncbi:MAG: dTMP kinase [Spirochaetaceae bacterium]|nr:MAG: dTMP kinase [Spirochaetaceae bacterium]